MIITGTVGCLMPWPFVSDPKNKFFKKSPDITAFQQCLFTSAGIIQSHRKKTPSLKRKL
jgi:hypothetical protein